MTMKVGTKVEWISSSTQKIGEVVAVVPPGKMPIDLGFQKLDNSGLPRDQESYIIRANHARGAYTKQVRTYWPRVSLLNQYVPDPAS